MGRIEDRLAELGLKLPAAKTPVANYLGTKRSGDLLFVSARVSRLQGSVGKHVSLGEAKTAARDTVLELLSIIRLDVELDSIVSVEKMVGYVRSARDFVQQPQVIDGASDLLFELFGESGRHARTATGVAQAPFGAAVQLEMVLRIEAS